VQCVSHNAHATVWMYKEIMSGATMVITAANATYLPMQKQSWAVGVTPRLATLTTACAQTDEQT
jgi:hypothetical protein